MAVIRIIDLPENSSSLIDELRARGFTIASGPEGQTAAADLELSVHECSIEEALEKCAQTGGEPATIFIAPGAVDDAWRPIVSVPLIPSESFDHQAAPETSAPESNQLEPANTMEPAVPMGADAAPVIMAAISQDTAAANALESEHELQPAPAELDVSHRAEMQSSMQPDSEPVETESVPVEAISVDRAEVLQSSVVPEESKPVTREVAESNEEYLPSDWPIWNPLREPVFAVQEAMDEQKKGTASAAFSENRPGVASWSRLRWDEKFFWKAAPVAAALALAAFFAMTLAHRVSPLPPAISQAEEQTQQPPLARSHDGHDADGHDARLQKVSAESSLLPDRLNPRRTDMSSASTGVTIASQRQRIHSARSAASTRDESGFVAPDTVVRYPGKKANPETGRKPAETASRASGVKYYSDISKAPR